jgi:hypothetical protein
MGTSGAESSSAKSSGEDSDASSAETKVRRDAGRATARARPDRCGPDGDRHGHRLESAHVGLAAGRYRTSAVGSGRAAAHRDGSAERGDLRTDPTSSFRWDVVGLGTPWGWPRALRVGRPAGRRACRWDGRFHVERRWHDAASGYREHPDWSAEYASKHRLQCSATNTSCRWTSAICRAWINTNACSRCGPESVVADIPSDVKDRGVLPELGNVGFAGAVRASDPRHRPACPRMGIHGTGGSGLVRRALDRAVTAWASQSGSLDTQVTYGDLLGARGELSGVPLLRRLSVADRMGQPAVGRVAGRRRDHHRHRSRVRPGSGIAGCGRRCARSRCPTCPSTCTGWWCECRRLGRCRLDEGSWTWASWRGWDL